MCAVELELNIIFNHCPALHFYFYETAHIQTFFFKLRREIFICFTKLADSNPLSLH